MRALLALLILALGACRSPVEEIPAPTLAVTVGGWMRAMEWPFGSGDTVRLYG